MSRPYRSVEFHEPPTRESGDDAARGFTLLIVCGAAVMATLLALQATPVLLGDSFTPTPASVLMALPR